MSAIDRLYDINNRTLKKSINIDDSLYKKLIYLTQNRFDATVSDLINVAIEDYSEKNRPVFYGKPENETVIYRSVMLREDNIKWLNDTYKETRISVTRLVNVSIKEFIDKVK